MSALRKNVASQVLTFNLVNATTGGPLLSASVTTKVTLDGTQSPGAGTVTEQGTGQYKYVPTQGETNGASAGFSFTATNAVPVNLHCFTLGQDPTQSTWQVDVAKWAGTATTLTSGLPDVNMKTITAGIIAAASFGSGALDAVWSTATRALTDKAGFSLSVAGVQAIWDALTSALTTVGSIGKWVVDKLDVVVSTRAATGAAMTLTSGERTAIANEVEAQIIDDTDSEKVLQAITDKIASVNPSLSGLTLAAIASQVRTELATELARIDAAISTRLAATGYTAPDNIGIANAATSAYAVDSRLPASPAAVADIGAALDAVLADSIPAVGDRPSARQALYILAQFFLNRDVGGTTMTVRKPDGTTVLLTLTLDDASTPRAYSRTT